MNAEAAPQLQKDRSETDSADTAGGAYASRDDPRAQAAQPIEGKSDEQIVQVGEEWEMSCGGVALQGWLQATAACCF